MPTREDIIQIDQAATLYGVARRSLEKLVAQGTLHRAEVPLDQHTYLLRAELAAFFQVRVVPAPGEQQAAEDAG